MLIVRPSQAAVGERESVGDEAVGAEQAADRLPFARVVVVLKALAGLQNTVAAVGSCAFRFLLVAGDFEMSGAVLEGIESR